MIEWGSREKFLRTVVAPQLGHLPPALVDKPELSLSLQFVLGDFLLLSKARQYIAVFDSRSKNQVMQKMPITMSDIINYYSFSSCGYEVSKYIRLIQSADQAYLTSVRK